MWMVVLTINFYTRLTLWRGRLLVLVNQPQDQVCLEAVTVVVTWPSPIYVDTQPYHAQPYTWTPPPTQPSPILSIQRPAHSAPALSLCACGWGPQLPEARHQDDRGGGDNNGDDYNYDDDHHHLGWFSMIMIIAIILWALFARGWRAPRRLPPYGEPTPGQLFHTLPNNLLFLWDVALGHFFSSNFHIT